MTKKYLRRIKIVTLLLTVLLAISFFALFLPHAAAAQTKIISISPEKGRVRAEVSVNGTIETTNGTYRILFNEEKVKKGTIVGNNVNITFIVPHRPAGNYSITLQDINATSGEVLSSYVFERPFTIETAFYVEAIAPSPPGQLQEGDPVPIWVNITGGEIQIDYYPNITVATPGKEVVYFNDTISTSVDDETGDMWINITYPKDFQPLGAHTNFTGTYKIALNETYTGLSQTGDFIIGLTNAAEYHRYQVVNIQAAGYMPNEPVNVTLASAGETVFSPENLTASSSGMVIANWVIPANATYGSYTVTVSNSTTPGTVKPVADVQNFTIVKKTVSCRIQTVDLESEPVEGVEVKAYDGYNETQQIGSRKTDKNGSAEFKLDAGKYVFKAFWKDLEVKSSIFDVAKDMNQTMVCQLAHIKVKVTDEAGMQLPFINVNLTCSYTKDNETVTETDLLETNSTGRVAFRNLLTNVVTDVNYTLEARRYGNLFYTKLIENLTSTCCVNITCPTYTLTIELFDSNELPFQNATLAVYEWSSGLSSAVWTHTNSSGSVAVNRTFGRYKVRAYVSEIAINETTVDLVNETQKLQVYCNILNLTLSAKVVDYFGHVIPNVKVEVKREGIEPSESITGADGKAVVHLKVGGDCQMNLTLPGESKPCETLPCYLDWAKTESEITFKLDRYVMVGGCLLETSQLTTIITLAAMVVIFAVALTYRRFLHTKTAKE